MAKYIVRLKKYTSPQFMHNAMSAGKLPVWTYEYWDETDDKKRQEFTIAMTKNMGGKENDQSKKMNDAALKYVTGNIKNSTAKLTTK